MTETATIAERKLLVQQPNGEKKEIIVKIGTPYWVTEGEEAACPVAIEGLHGKLPDVHGVDPYQALELAIQLTQTLVAPSGKQKILWPDGKPYEVKSTTRQGSRKKKAKARPARRTNKKAQRKKRRIR